MRILYIKPVLKDMPQGSRIAFVRCFILMTQDNVFNRLVGECKRRTIIKLFS